MTDSGKASREIAHGRMLVRDDPEYIWGWATAAGRRRADRRAALIANAAVSAPGLRALRSPAATGMFPEMFTSTERENRRRGVSKESYWNARAGAICRRIAFGLIAARVED